MSSISPAHRLSWLDATRGIAICAVLIAHTCAAAWPTYDYFHTHIIDIGHAGVILFFFCSGYIIPVSLESTSLARFWARRFFRLYPIYWLSIILLLSTGVTATYDPGTVIANITMLQNFLGYYHLVGIYWSLTVEMAFYLLLSLAYLVRALRQPVVLCGLMLSIAAVADVLLPAMGQASSGGWIASHLGTMTLGTLFYHLHQKSLSPRLVRSFFLLSLLIQILSCWQAPAFLAARLLGYGAFGLVMWARGAVVWPRWLVWAGTISYSIYLMHIIVLRLLPPRDALGVVAVVAASALLSSGTYYLIERPGIALGRAVLSRRPEQSSRPSPSV